MQPQTKEGKKLQKDITKGLDGFALMFANAIKFDDLAQALKK